MQYFDEYFRAIKAKTIVVESGYTDRDYLEDFAAFYVRCLDRYPPRCVRLHFFDVRFTKDALLSAAKGRRGRTSQGRILSEAFLKQSYLGFIVVKPLPGTFIGRTCLKTYDDSDERQFPVAREYPVHLLGFDLPIESLAFQEQDKVAAACATSALWSAFQGTSHVFQHELLTPIEITRRATDHQPSSVREIPNQGLSLDQVAAAIRHVGLEPESLRIDSGDTLRAITHAYLHRAKIPLMLMCTLYEIGRDGNVSYYANNEENAHAVTITGYRLNRAAVSELASDLLMSSSRIGKLYLHDDQVGPFSRATFSDERIEWNGERLVLRAGRPNGDSETVAAPVLLESEWSHLVPGRVVFSPYGIVVPLYHKIRLPLSEFLKVLRRYDELLAESVGRLEWDVFLDTGAHLKREYRLGKTLGETERAMLLQRQLPRFVWRAIGRAGARVKLELLQDATDVPQGVEPSLLVHDQRLLRRLPV